MNSIEFEHEEETIFDIYLSGYIGALAIEQQFDILQTLPMDITKNSSVGQANFKAGEGQFLIPNPYKFFEGYNQAIIGSLEILDTPRGHLRYGRNRNQLDNPQHIRRTYPTENAWKQISESQGNPDILVISAQFGFQHRSRSVHRVREIMESLGQFGLGVYEVAMMLLTHPKRLEQFNDLWIDCPGDEISDIYSNSGWGKQKAPYFRFNGGKVELGMSWIDYVRAYSGSASAFFLLKEARDCSLDLFFTCPGVKSGHFLCFFPLFLYFDTYFNITYPHLTK